MTTLAVSVGTAPVVVFTPQAVTQSMTIVNEGIDTVYLGQTGVTAATGFPLAPGQTMNLPIVTQTIYGVSGAANLISPTAVTNASVSATDTALPVASGGTSFTNGMAVAIQDGNSSEIVTVGAGSTGTSVVVSALAFDHASGVTFGRLGSTNNTSLKVIYGV